MAVWLSISLQAPRISYIIADMDSGAAISRERPMFVRDMGGWIGRIWVADISHCTFLKSDGTWSMEKWEVRSK